MKSLLGLVFALALAQDAHAGPPAPVALAEIKYLLDYMGSSGCEFYRNGTWYDAGKAKDHLRFKYDVLVQHDQIGTAEDFIEKAATKSSLSGLAYKVRCAGGQELPSNQWLRDALARYRLKDSHDAVGPHGVPPPVSGGARMLRAE